MKINFENLKVFTDISKTKSTTVNIKHDLADNIYKNSIGIVYHSLALKIYNSVGECELTDEEYKLLIDYAEQNFTPIIIDALKNCK